jgi:hypothetical protein
VLVAILAPLVGLLLLMWRRAANQLVAGRPWLE